MIRHQQNAVETFEGCGLAIRDSLTKRRAFALWIKVSIELSLLRSSEWVLANDTSAHAALSVEASSLSLSMRDEFLWIERKQKKTNEKYFKETKKRVIIAFWSPPPMFPHKLNLATLRSLHKLLDRRSSQRLHPQTFPLRRDVQTRRSER